MSIFNAAARRSVGLEKRKEDEVNEYLTFKILCQKNSELSNFHNVKENTVVYVVDDNCSYVYKNSNWIKLYDI